MLGPKSLHTVAVPVVLLGLYVGSGSLGLHLAYLTPNATAVWPPTGIALAALLVFGTRLWPVVFAGATVLNLLSGATLVGALVTGVGNSLEAIVGASLVRRYARGADAFDRAADAFRFAGLTAVLATPISATIGVFALWITDHAIAAPMGHIWLTWWLGDAAAALVLAPPLVLWARRGTSAQSAPARPVEIALLYLGLMATSLVIFGDVAGIGSGAPLMFLTFPFLSWAVFRTGSRGATSMMALVAMLAIWGAANGYGPFVHASPNTTLLLLQAFMAVTSVMVFAGAAIVAERNRVEAELHRLSVTDPLTGLGNYRQLARTLESDLLRRDTEFAILLLDVDGLKAINDRDGHLAGSRVLGRLAQCLRRACPPGATIARYGGDEFVVALPASGEADARAVVRKLDALLAADAETPTMSVSVGLALFPRDGRDIDRLLDAADREVYAAKARAGADESMRFERLRSRFE